MSDLPVISTALPWQKEEWTRLVSKIDSERLPHALLITGVRYAGKARLATALARLLLCHQSEAGHNCGTCHACELSRSGNHGDFRWLEPEAGKSRVIKVDQVRQLVEFASKTASLGRRKVVVMSPADSMNTQAANALLKLLEEPAPDTYIILVCHRLQGLPATIRSRCQMLKIMMPEQGECLQWLDKFTGLRSDSEKALNLARGQALLAEKIYRGAELEKAEAVNNAIEELVSGSGDVQALEALMAEEGIEELLVQLQQLLSHHIQQMDAAALGGNDGRSTFALLDDVIALQRAVQSGANPNRQLLVDSLSLRFDQVF